MEFKKIDENTIRCIIDEDDMQEHNIELEDFLKNNEVVHKFLHKMVERAEDEIGYKPTGGIISMQLMQLPQNKLSITFSESSQEKIGEIIKHIADASIQEVIEKVADSKVEDINVVEKEPSNLRIYSFDSFDSVLMYCKSIPKRVIVRSDLYKDSESGKYYLIFDKVRISVTNYKYICNNAIEFGELVSDNPLRKAWIEEHFKCVIKSKAIGVLRKL